MFAHSAFDTATFERCARSGHVILPIVPIAHLLETLLYPHLVLHNDKSYERMGAMDRETFAALVTPHLSDLVRVAQGFVGMTDAEDAAQEALTRAWLARDSLRDRSAMRAWLIQIEVNLCRNWWNGRYGSDRTRQTELAAAAAFMSPFNPASSDAAAALDLRAALLALGDDDRMLIILRFYVDLNASEIGQIFTTPAATIRTRLRRALERLRVHLQAESHMGQEASHD